MIKSRSLGLKTSIIFATSLVLGLAFNYLFYAKVPGISFPIFVALVILSLWLVAFFWEIRFSRAVWAALGASVFFAALLAIRANPFLSFLNVFISFYLLALGVSAATREFSWNKFRSFLYPFSMPVRFLGGVPWSLARLSESRSSKENNYSEQVIRGLVMALPILILFIFLFASADLVIRDYFLRIFDIEDLSQSLARVAIVLVISVFAIGTFGHMLSRLTSAAAKNKAVISSSLGKLGLVQTSVFLGCIALLFLGFILFQSWYLFGGAAAFEGHGFTYAEYARRGFFELLAVAIITFGLLWISENSVTRTQEKHSLQFRIISGVLILEVLLIIFSAFQRLSLYEEVFGLTTARLWSHAFTVWLAAGFVILAWKILRNLNSEKFLIASFISLLLALATMNALNPDVLIARNNFDMFSRGSELDAFYLAHLSSDAMPEILAVFEAVPDEHKQQIAKVLEVRHQEYSAKEYNSWQSFNLSRENASRLLATKMEEISEYSNEIIQ